MPTSCQAWLDTGHGGEQKGDKLCPCVPHGPSVPWQPLTNDDECHRDGVGQQVAPHRLLVLAIALAEEADQRVQLVLAQALWVQDTALTPWLRPVPFPVAT